MRWEKKTLGDISIKIQTGPFGSQLHQSDYSEFGTPVVMPKNLINGKISEESIARVSKNYVDRLSRHKIEIGDILCSRRGDVGRCAFTTAREKDWLCGTGCLKITINREIANPQFIFYQLQKAETVGWVINHAVGSTMLNLNTSILSNVPIELPKIEVQNKIVDILSDYDNLIENNLKQIKLLEEAAKRLYKEWFVDLHFPGYKYVKIDVDGVPKGWIKTGILDNDLFCLSKSRVKPFNGEKQYYATADVTNTYFATNGEFISYDNKPSRAQFEPKLNSVWFARMSNSYKIIGFTKANKNRLDKTVLSSGFCGFETSRKDWGFVYCTISSNYFNSEKDRYATGATQVSLTNEGLKKIKVLIPSDEIIEQFGELVNPIVDKIVYLYEYNISLQEARDRLLPKLMSGEIEV